MSGLEDLFGKLMSDEMMKSLAEGVKEGMKEGHGGCGHDETWCHINGDKPVKNWLVLRVTEHGTCGFDKAISCYKKKLAPFLNALPEGQGVVFLPSNIYLEVTPNVEGN